MTISGNVLRSITSLLAVGLAMPAMMPFLRAIQLLRSFGVGLEFGRRGDLTLFARLLPRRDSRVLWSAMMIETPSWLASIAPSGAITTPTFRWLAPSHARSVRGHSVLARGGGRLFLRITTVPDYTDCGSGSQVYLELPLLHHRSVTN